MPLLPQQVKELREVNKKLSDDNERLKKIANYDAKMSLPVVLYLLEEIKRILITSQEMEEKNLATKSFVEYAIQTLKETDEKQNASLWKLRSTLKGLTKEKVLGELQKFVNHVDKLTVTPQTKLLWLEVALWLEGLYKRIEIKIPKNKDGSLVKNKKGEVGTIDAEDFLFHSIVGLTKFEVVLHYHLVSEAILKKAELCLEIAEALKPEPTSNVEPPLVEPEIGAREELPYEFLEKYFEDDPDIKFSILICALNYYKLNSDQQFFLGRFKDIIQAGLRSYINSNFTSWGLPTCIVARPYIKEVTNTLEKINDSTDPTQHLVDVFDLLLFARGVNSWDVKKITSSLLEKAYTILFRNSKQTTPQHQI